MQFCFADDSDQKKPSRPGMNHRLVGVGGIFVSADEVGDLERALAELCRDTGFPTGDARRSEFKWSPKSDQWMKKQLVGDARRDFYLSALDLLVKAGGSVVVVVVDTRYGTATNTDDHEEDATVLFLERASNEFARRGDDGLVIVDRPSGGRKGENRFLADCIGHLRDALTFAVEERFALPVMATQSRFVRLLQLADVLTSVTVQHVSGEDTYSPAIFERIRPMLARSMSRAGGVGLKIHPDFKYRNLYHWLAGDDYFIVRFPTGHRLPGTGFQYVNGPHDTSSHRLTTL